VVGPVEAARRAVTRWSGTIHSLPILALSVHSACNCRCVMCDIWKANAEKRAIGLDELEHHVDSIRQLRVQRVMLTGGEPLLHSNLFALCDRLRAEGIRISLVTTGLLIEPHAADIARTVDELVISIDGPAAVHDRIRRVPGGFARIDRGLRRLAEFAPGPTTIARSVVQRANHATLAQTVRAVRDLGVARLSFLAADVSSSAFNRPEPWSAERRCEIALSREQLPVLAAAVSEVEDICRDPAMAGFIAGGVRSLWRIHAYYRALAGMSEFPPTRCNAPWVSAVLEPGGQVRPCFFHEPYAVSDGLALADILNAPAARAFRRALKVNTNETCRRCVCSLSLPLRSEA
jgi:Fe-coproporphyrin III synthase